MPQRSSRGWTRAAILGLEPCWDRKVCYGSKLSPVSTRGTSRLRYSSQWPSTSYHHFSDKNQKGKIQREGYIGVKKAYYTAKLLPGKDKTTQTYKICRNKNRDSKPDIDAKNLANQRRYRKTAKAHFNRASENPRQDLVDKQRPRPARSPTRTNTTSTKPSKIYRKTKLVGKWGSPTDPRGRENCRSGKPYQKK